MCPFKEPTSGLEPLTCSLRVRNQWLLSVARVCKSRIGKEFTVPCTAQYCTVLRVGQGQTRVKSA
jgi:hypothetical protein